ncbi:MAG: protease modulator HflC, partial [Armatimonadota bacterium]
NWRTIVGTAVFLVLVWRTLFAVDETQHVIVTQFGRPVRQIVDSPGLHCKLPYQSLVRFDNRLLLYDPTASEFLTMDKKNVLIDTFVAWRIRDPIRFLQAVTNIAGAEPRLHEIVWAELSATLGKYPLDALVSSEAPVQTDQIMRAVRHSCSEGRQASAAGGARPGLSEYGIEIADVRIKRINLPEQNKQSVFDRMRAERQRDAKRYRAEGEQEALKIRADADKQRETILSEAYREAGRIKGDGEASATRIYAEAYNRDPEFYKLTRTLESYEKLFDKDTTALLSSDSELLRIMTRGPKAAAGGR